MVDVSNRVFTNVRAYVLSKYPNVNCQNTQTASPVQLPTLGFRQIDNSEVGLDLSYGSFEDDVAVECNCEIQVFANDDFNEARNIMMAACEAMRAMSFARTFGASLIEEKTNTGVWRIVARFARIVSGLDEIPKFNL